MTSTTGRHHRTRTVLALSSVAIGALALLSAAFNYTMVSVRKSDLGWADLNASTGISTNANSIVSLAAGVLTIVLAALAFRGNPGTKSARR